MLTPIIHRRTKDSLIRQRGNSREIQRHLELISDDIVKWEDDFLGDTLHSGYQAANNGTAAANIAISAPTSAVADGQATLVSGTDDDGYSGASLGLHYYGSRHAVTSAILKVSAITTVKFEFGFTDVTAGTDAGATNVLATPTFNATDFAGWVFDTDDTTGLQAVGVKNGTAATKVEPSSINGNDGDATPNADEWLYLAVALRGTDARFYAGLMHDGSNDNAKRLTITYDSDWKSGFITSTVALTPWVFVQSRAGAASRTLTLDKWTAYQYRYTAD